MLFFVLLLTIILTWFGLQRTWTQAFFWLGSCVCSAAIVLGIWLIADATHFGAILTQSKYSKEDEVGSIASTTSTSESQLVLTDNVSQVTAIHQNPIPTTPMTTPSFSVDSNIVNVSELNVKMQS